MEIARFILIALVFVLWGAVLIMLLVFALSRALMERKYDRMNRAAAEKHAADSAAARAAGLPPIPPPNRWVVG
jgi:hypothetical protein